jgi:hypothetical protein
MRATSLLLGLVLILALAGCPEKKRAAPAESQPVGSDPSPAVRPVQEKVDDSLKRGADRTTPDVED